MKLTRFPILTPSWMIIFMLILHHEFKKAMLETFQAKYGGSKKNSRRSRLCSGPKMAILAILKPEALIFVPCTS